MKLADIETNNNNDLVIINKDIAWHKGEGSKLFALRNYLKINKHFIVEYLTEETIAKLILNKCLELGLDVNLITFNLKEIRKGIINIELKLRSKVNVIK